MILLDWYYSRLTDLLCRHNRTSYQYLCCALVMSCSSDKMCRLRQPITSFDAHCLEASCNLTVLSYRQQRKHVLSHCFNGHVPGGPGLAGSRMFPFWILLELMSKCHHQQTNTQFLQAGCPSCGPTNSVRALNGVLYVINNAKHGRPVPPSAVDANFVTDDAKFKRILKYQNKSSSAVKQASALKMKIQKLCSSIRIAIPAQFPPKCNRTICGSLH